MGSWYKLDEKCTIDWQVATDAESDKCYQDAQGREIRGSTGSDAKNSTNKQGSIPGKTAA